MLTALRTSVSRSMPAATVARALPCLPPRMAVRSLSVSARAAAEYKHILTSPQADGKVTLIQLNRPKALNALNSELFHEINDATAAADADPSVYAIVLTGSEKAFAAGADIKEMKDQTYAEAYKSNFLGHWSQLTTVRKPIIAAVSGYALGGGCELMMMCDIALAAPSAVFGQPEINLGVIPGGGGSQRLCKAVGKSLAMEMVLTGHMIKAPEAASRGLVSRVVGEDQNVVEEAVKIGAKIATKSQIAAQAGKEAVNAGTFLYNQFLFSFCCCVLSTLPVIQRIEG